MLKRSTLPKKSGDQEIFLQRVTGRDVRREGTDSVQFEWILRAAGHLMRGRGKVGNLYRFGTEEGGIQIGDSAVLPTQKRNTETYVTKRPLIGEVC